jgi:hypothetical protein
LDCRGVARSGAYILYTDIYTVGDSFWIILLVAIGYLTKYKIIYLDKHLDAAQGQDTSVRDAVSKGPIS